MCLSFCFIHFHSAFIRPSIYSSIHPPIYPKALFVYTNFARGKRARYKQQTNKNDIEGNLFFFFSISVLSSCFCGHIILLDISYLVKRSYLLLWFILFLLCQWVSNGFIYFVLYKLVPAKFYDLINQNKVRVISAMRVSAELHN